jgi:hypothetical protein
MFLLSSAIAVRIGRRSLPWSARKDASIAPGVRIFTIISSRPCSTGTSEDGKQRRIESPALRRSTGAPPAPRIHFEDQVENKKIPQPETGGECRRIGGTKPKIKSIACTPHSIDSAIALPRKGDRIIKRKQRINRMASMESKMPHAANESPGSGCAPFSWFPGGQGAIKNYSLNIHRE